MKIKELALAENNLNSNIEIQALAFSVENESYALEMSHIEQLISSGYREIDTIADMPNGLMGETSFRDNKIKVINCGLALGKKKTTIRDMPIVIVFRANNEQYGLLVDELEGIITLREKDRVISSDSNDELGIEYCNINHTVHLLSVSDITAEINLNTELRNNTTDMDSGESEDELMESTIAWLNYKKDSLKAKRMMRELDFSNKSENFFNRINSSYNSAEA